MIGLRAAAIVTCSGAPDDGAPGWVTLDGDHVVGIGPEPLPGADRLDLGDLQLWPGMVDLHADSLGRFESPRAGTRVPLNAAVHDFARDAALHGITRPYLCVSVGEGPDPATSLHRAREIVHAVDQLGPVLPVPLPIHLRIDIGSESCIHDAHALLQEYPQHIALLSAMDHTPGRGQYRDIDTWRPAMRARTGADDSSLDHWLSWLPHDPSIIRTRRRAVAALARDHHLPFASHDDDSPDAAARSAADGATISEFPLTPDTAATAHRAGLTVVMGAPNAWHGHSHLNGLSARDALSSGHLDALTSDYHSGAMARAVIAVVEAGICALPAAVHLVTAGPAHADPNAAARGAGTIAVGGPADVIGVDTGHVPGVVCSWTTGRLLSFPRSADNSGVGS